MSETTRRIHTTLLGYFLRGLLLLVPITLMIWAIWQSLAFLDSIIKTDIPGLGLLILCGIILAAGWLGSTFLYQPIADLGEELLQRIPFLKTLYGALKDLVEALVGNKRKFDRPVLVRLGGQMDVERLGFITQDDLTHLGVGPDKVAVYLPHAFNWSGNLYIVPRANLTPLETSATDVMKFVVSGGVSTVDDDAE
ncbi:MAG: DUF502 domain-containing protein [Flavobacteriales bacterium]|jgi:uncharacterized membrane protein|nr:DUF502 domain-containing protein [Flavobacteriales bacterium]MBK9513792.1 DUF502 domain-containing protein [Flavobacteriales bacterium]HOY30146.1 DUF502 domain-containing protein [Flavobacteriales bacterium]